MDCHCNICCYWYTLSLSLSLAFVMDYDSHSCAHDMCLWLSLQGYYSHHLFGPHAFLSIIKHTFPKSDILLLIQFFTDLMPLLIALDETIAMFSKNENISLFSIRLKAYKSSCSWSLHLWNLGSFDRRISMNFCPIIFMTK